VGSGLEKLELLRLVRKERVGVWSAQILGFAVLILVLTLLQPLAQWTTEPGLAWLGAAILMLFVIAVAGIDTFNALQHYRDRLGSRFTSFHLQTTAGDIAWFDVYAGMDLVPMGDNSQLGQSSFVEQIPVTNEATVVGDHVRYFQTRGDFVPQCWALLSRFSTVVRFGTDDVAQLERARRWHRRRAIGLVSGQYLNPLTALAAALLATGAVHAIGKSVMDLLAKGELTWPRRLLSWISEFLAGALKLVLASDAVKPADLPDTVVGALAVLLGLVCWWTISMGFCRANNHHLSRLVARGSRFRSGDRWDSVVGSTGVLF